jgi:hypothetical protein
MTAIHTIRVVIETADVDGAGTDDDVWLGIGGREFKCSISSINNFERGMSTAYIFGEGSNVRRKDINDPRKPSLTEADVQAFPVYIRGAPSGPDEFPAWAFRRASVFINDDSVERCGRWFRDAPLWIQPESTFVVHLRKYEELRVTGGTVASPATG